MSVEANIEKLSSLFKEIKHTEYLVTKKRIIGELRVLAQETFNLMDHSEELNNNNRRKQIFEVLKKCDAI